VPTAVDPEAKEAKERANKDAETVAALRPRTVRVARWLNQELADNHFSERLRLALEGKK
jgi:hypothetical protein